MRDLVRRTPVGPVIAIVILAIMILGCARDPSNVADVSRDEEIRQLFEEEWLWSAKQDPITASTFGEKAYNDLWPDLSPSALAEANEHRKEIVSLIEEIEEASIEPATYLDAQLLRRDYLDRIRRHEDGLDLLALNHMGGLQTADELVYILPFETERDYEDYLSRLESFPEVTAGVMSLMRRGIEEGIMLPRVVMERVPGQIERRLVSDPEESLYYAPFRAMPEAIAAERRAELAERGRLLIHRNVIPSLVELRDFVWDEYLESAPEEVGIWTFDETGEIYAGLAREHTTTGLSPDEIHEIGLIEVERIRGEMERIMADVGFEGTLVEFNEHLRSDPRFYFESGEDLLEAYRATSKRVDPELVALFRTMPRMPYGVTPIPAESAPDTYAAFYYPPAPDGTRAGTYFVNLYRPDQRPKYEIMALTLHEAVPGHHFQLALAQELGEVPKFRRFLGYTAFREGWGLYAESLGDEMGLYEDPYDKFGQLTYEMWRAIRLVVDTGIHAKRWTRQQAIDFFIENAAKSELDVVNEIDRYIVDPGQALAYKIGELKIRELRELARKSLGVDFDVRDFHDVVLLNGGVPLDVLEDQVERWIEATRNGEGSSSSG